MLRTSLASWVLAISMVAGIAHAQAPDAARAFAAAKQQHADAQARERTAACSPGDQPCKAQIVVLFEAASRAYTDYLARSGPLADAVAARLSRAEILSLKLDRPEAAGDDYLAVGKSQPVGPLHRDALVKAVINFDAARQRLGRASPIDDKLRAAADLYAVTFAGGPDLVEITFRLANLDADRGLTDDAIRRFSSIATKYPASAEAGAAADRWLSILSKKPDLAALDEATSAIAKLPAFASPEQQARLAAIRYEVASKRGESAVQAQRYADAADHYLRAAAATTDPRRTTQAMFNAAVTFERGRMLERAVTTYRSLADKFPREPLAIRARFTVAKLDEIDLRPERAADDFEQLATEAPTDPLAADALYNAGVLRVALGQRDRAIALLDRYVAKFAARRDVPQVAIAVARLREDAGDRTGALSAYLAAAARFRSDGAALEALVGSARVALALGRDKQAADQLRAAFALATPRKREERGKRLVAEILILQARVASKAKRWADAEQQLTGIAELGDPVSTVAALREGATIGEAAGTPRPQLIARYEAAYAKALALGIVSEDTIALRDALVRLGALSADPMARDGARIGAPPVPPLEQRQH